MPTLKLWDGFQWVSIAGGIGGGSSSSIKSIRNTVTISSDTSSVPIGINDYKHEKDILFVFQNSVFLNEGADYTVSSDGKNVNTVGEPWTVPTTLDFVVIYSIDTHPDAITTSCLEASYTAITDGTLVAQINQPLYKADTDYLQVYCENLLLYEGNNYTLRPDKISIELNDWSLKADPKVY